MDDKPPDPDLWGKHDFRVIIGRTKIDFDPNKEDENRKKHKYSLLSGVHLLERLLIPMNAPPMITSVGVERDGEIRHLHMTLDGCGKVIFMVTTMRPDETVHVISLRRAHDNEEVIYRQVTRI